MQSRPLALLVLAATSLAAPALAHHSWARYDGEHIIELTGAITSIAWGLA